MIFNSSPESELHYCLIDGSNTYQDVTTAALIIMESNINIANSAFRYNENNVATIAALYSNILLEDSAISNNRILNNTSIF